MKLLDNREYAAADITLDPVNQRFYDTMTGEDLTRLIKNADKKTFGGFDQTLSNDLAYKEIHPGTPEVGSTSVTGNFFKQIITDPLDAPAEFAQDATNAAKKAIQSPVTWGIVALGVVALVIWFVPRKP